jgi:hypothetical protein
VAIAPPAPHSPRSLVALAVAITLATALSGCSPGDSGGSDRDQAPAGSSSLASALDLVPALPDGHVMFTDWSMLGHPTAKDATGTAFAGQLLSVDDVLHRDLGIRSTEADWELDVWRSDGPSTIVLRYGAGADLNTLPGKLSSAGYRADGTVYTHAPDASRMWTLPLGTIAVDPDRRLLVGGSDANMVRSVMAGTAQGLGHADPVTPLLAVAATRLDRIVTASVAVGSAACVTLADVIGKGRATPAMLDAVRKQFPGTFTPPQAEITAVADPAGTTALDALTFPDQHTAKANQASRTAAAQQFSTLVYGAGDAIRATDSAVSGRVLSVDLAANALHDFPRRVVTNGLGVDICT